MDCEVEEIGGELFRYHVRSRSRAEVLHVVDLESFRWAGECSCEAFCFRYKPELERGAQPDDSLRCVHIRACRAYVLDNVLPKLAGALRAAQRAPAVARNAEPEEDQSPF